uniref:collagen alpha-1(I) chain-like n=1 Tax=Nyctereutes procyonoides TaxID=34880 RepID=UPI002443BB2F|nr:collagen alpha-1(I) chain-like [Nyctereutes procyonoides]
MEASASPPESPGRLRSQRGLHSGPHGPHGPDGGSPVRPPGRRSGQRPRDAPTSQGNSARVSRVQNLGVRGGAGGQACARDRSPVTQPLPSGARCEVGGPEEREGAGYGPVPGAASGTRWCLRSGGPGTARHLGGGPGWEAEAPPPPPPRPGPPGSPPTARGPAGRRGGGSRGPREAAPALRPPAGSRGARSRTETPGRSRRGGRGSSSRAPPNGPVAWRSRPRQPALRPRGGPPRDPPPAPPGAAAPAAAASRPEPTPAEPRAASRECACSAGARTGPG